MSQIDHEARADAFARRLGAHLKKLRTAKGLTQTKVAELLGPGVALETVSRFERGAHVPSLVWLSRLATVYDTSIDEVYLGAIERRLSDDAAKQELHDLVDSTDGTIVRAALAAIEMVKRAATPE